MAALTNLLLVLTVGLTVATEVDLQKRVIGGGDCPVNERPYHVKFTYPSGSLLCGGSLISDQWILTAAHCWEEHMTAVLSPHPNGGQPAKFFKNHRDFIHESEKHDLMLVQLEQPTNTPHIPLPDCAKRRLHVGDVVQIAGYGSNQVGPKDDEAPVLQCADFKVIGSSLASHKPRNLTSECFIVSTDHADVTSGDSGGGVVFNNTIYGVVQGKGGPNYAHSNPSFFLDVCYYMKWITNITGITP